MSEFSLAQHLVENILPDAGLGTAGIDLFYGVAPDEKPPDKATVVVIDSGGIDPAKNADRTHYQPTIQIIVYGPIEDWITAQQKMEEIRTYLVDIMPSKLIAATRYYGIHQQGDIISLGQDANKRPRLSTNFRFNRRFAIIPLLDTFTESVTTPIYNHTSDSGHNYLFIPSENNAIIVSNQLNASAALSWSICDNDWGNRLNGTLEFQIISNVGFGNSTPSAFFRFKDTANPGYEFRIQSTSVNIYRQGIFVTTLPITTIIPGEYVRIILINGSMTITIDPGGLNERTVSYTDPIQIMGQYKCGLRCNANGIICDNLTFIPA